jgi:hypothetical protein
MRRPLSLLLLLVFLSPRAQAVDFATRVIEATFKVTNPSSTATSWFVADPETAGETRPGMLLVTASHVLIKSTGDTASLVLRDLKPDGSYKRRDFPFPIRAAGKPLWYKHPTEDIAVIRVKLPPDVRVRPVPFETLSTEKALSDVQFHPATQIYICGYPARFEVNPAGFPVARNATVASYPILPVKIYKTFSADMTTFSGDSGGPVFMSDPRCASTDKNGQPLLVGMVLAQWRHDEEVKTLYEEMYIHHPLALSVCVHAHYIREAIEQYAAQ